MKYVHTNINSPNWERLSEFYQKVFDCKPVPPIRHLYGEWFERASGIKGAEVHGIHLALPGYQEGGPTVEILTHTNGVGEKVNAFNTTGFSHIAIHVDDVEAVYKKVLAAGGSSDGEITSKYYENMDKTLTIVYAKDPDGNIIEIQHWDAGMKNA